ncbi:hypothetical protein [Alicyclobacillus sp. SO9]|uniref:hypothetical protein n=1 Tax=Alicyclobacillus sp. SO9 TaxID=2665646 RepID=UPI0018E7A030|nr:hypothetical protein [Alicyclobacillus sp. SO9]QQE78662.1 hypothetical protein GI364_22870 [Alicyclobacillus sp. SO9]
MNVDRMIRSAKPHYKQNVVNVDDFRQQLYATLEQTSPPSRRHFFLTKKSLWFSIPGVLLLMGAGYASVAYFTSNMHTTPKPLTKAQNRKDNLNTSALYTNFGTFYKTSHFVKLPKSEIAQGIANVNSQTKEVITKDGMFVTYDLYKQHH